MQTVISQQCLSLFCSLLLGFFLGLCYEPLRILRAAVRHNAFFIGIQDFFFCIYCTFLTILLCFSCEKGFVRWYVIAGILLGLFFYFFTLGRLLKSLTAPLLCAIGRMLHALRRLLTPTLLSIRRLAVRLREKQKERGHARFQVRIKKRMLRQLKRGR